MLCLSALLLAGVVIYDYTAGISGEDRTNADVIKADRPDRATGFAREISKLNYFIANEAKVRSRYKAIAVPYAESIATFITLYSPGTSPDENIKKRISGLLPAQIKVGDILLSQVNQDNKGAQWMTATLNFGSSDSQAFEKAILTLGDANNGMVWKELSLAGDAEHHTLQASGQLALLVVEQAE